VFQKKNAKSLCTTILQPYLRESCGLQQNVQKEIVYTINASVMNMAIKYSLFCSWQWHVNYLKTKLTAKTFNENLWYKQSLR